jgi:hypothetical protein
VTATEFKGSRNGFAKLLVKPTYPLRSNDHQCSDVGFDAKCNHHAHTQNLRGSRGAVQPFRLIRKRPANAEWLTFTAKVATHFETYTDFVRNWWW